MTINKKIDVFLNRYNIKVLNDNRKSMQVYSYPGHYTEQEGNLTHYYSFDKGYLHTDYEKIYTIEIPESHLRYLAEIDNKVYQFNGSIAKYLEELVKKQEFEQETIQNNPVVKEAYEKFLSLLFLAGDNK